MDQKFRGEVDLGFQGFGGLRGWRLMQGSEFGPLLGLFLSEIKKPYSI